MKLLATLLILTVVYTELVAQERPDQGKPSIAKRALQEGIKLVSTNPRDTIVNVESIDNLIQFSGRTIRNIYVERIGFEKSIYDSARKSSLIISKLANALHADTRAKTLRQHIFFEEGQPLNPYQLADNERFIRDKDFILDCRIVVTPIEGSNLVDVTVIIRDVFSLGATIGGSFPNAPKVGVYDANVLGEAQRVQFTTLLDQARSPKFGYSILYRKSSLFGTLMNIDLEHTQINTGLSIGDEPEFTTLARITRPLVSPYLRLAGGMEISRNWSDNVYLKPDSAFMAYKYNVYDGWLGYNIGIKKTSSSRGRQFIAVRYFNGYYVDAPQVNTYQEAVRYHSAYGYLSEFSYYRQNFYKTRYVFGFGRTEDVPYGISVGLTGGYIEEVGTERPYGAVKAQYGAASTRGNFQRFMFQAGGYFRRNQLEDLVIQGTAERFTRALSVRRSKVRGMLSADYTQIINRNVSDWLTVGKQYIPGFNTDSLSSDKRLALRLQTVLYTPRAILGFRMAPFTQIDMIAVKCDQCDYRQNAYFGFSAGLRTRNENLIFGTMELMLTYIPQHANGGNKFTFGFKQNLRVKDTGVFATEPTLIRYNR